MFKFPAFPADLKIPAFDFKALVDVQQRNIDAVVAANTKLAEGAQEILKRQAEAVQGALKDGMEIARDSMSQKNVGVSVEKQIAFLKASADKGVVTARELAELANKNGTEAFEILRKRATDSVSELGALVKTAA